MLFSTKTVNVALKRDRFSKNFPTSLVVKVNEVMNLIENTLNTCEKSLETKYNNDLGSYIDLFR